MSEIKAILLCGSRIALPVMRDLVFHGQLAAVVIPEHCTDFTEQVKLLLNNSGIDIITVGNTDYVSRLQEIMKKHTVTIGLMFTFTYKLPESIYKIPVKGFYNLHPGPLPSYRGPDPIFQQVKNREAYGGLTIHKVGDSFDTGPVVLSDKIRLSVNDTYGTLTTKLGELATRLVGTLIKMAGFDMDIPSRAQDNTKSAYYKRQTAADISINWETMDAPALVALINACNPWNKGAVTKLNNNIVRLLEAYTVTPGSITGAPGTILSIDERGLTIATADNQAICVGIVYNDEGFLMAARLKDFGIPAGSRFDSI